MDFFAKTGSISRVFKIFKNWPTSSALTANKFIFLTQTRFYRFQLGSFRDSLKSDALTEILF